MTAELYSFPNTLSKSSGSPLISRDERMALVMYANIISKPEIHKSAFVFNAYAVAQRDLLNEICDRMKAKQ